MNLLKPKIKKFYTFIESPKLDRTAIKIIKGPYDGIIYTYGKCEFVDNKDSLTSKFEYNIIENPHKTISAKKFEKLAGDILMDIITDQVNDGTITKSLEKEIELPEDD